MKKVERLVQQQEKCGDGSRRQNVVGPADDFGNDIEGQHDEGTKNRCSHADHLPKQKNNKDGCGCADRHGDPSTFSGQREKAHAEKGEMKSADTQDMDNSGALIQLSRLLFQQALFSQTHGFYDRRILC